MVLTHTMADFDGLAAAVGLAKLWQDERPDDGEERLPTSSSIMLYYDLSYSRSDTDVSGFLAVDYRRYPSCSVLDDD